MFFINLHAHSVFSDGYSTPVIMAKEAVKLNFTALVLTEHFYGKGQHERGLTTEKLPSYEKAIAEAKNFIPVIRGLEVPFMGQEVIVFGGSVTKQIMRKGKLTEEDMEIYRKDHHCAIILCHPTDNHECVIPYIDGYEHYNSGQDYFTRGRQLGALTSKCSWYNSDAHHFSELKRCFNSVDAKIKREGQLIKYIKKQKRASLVMAKSL